MASTDTPTAGLPRTGGFVLITVIITLVPLIILAGATTSFLVGNSSRVRDRVADTKAFLAAESGIDWMIHQGDVGAITLSDGACKLDLGKGMLASLEYDNLHADGVDNDGDGTIDDDGEKVMRVRSTGRFGTSRRTLVAYLGFHFPKLITYSALGFQRNPNPILGPNVLVSGFNSRIDGSPGDPTFDAFGMSADAAEVPMLLSNIDATEAPNIVGAGGVVPSVGTGTSDTDTLIEDYRLSATRVLPSVNYQDVQWGSAPSGEMQITFADHTVNFAGNCYGAGVLVIKGHLKTTDNFRWDGVVIVYGNVQLWGNSEICGTLLMGTQSGLLQMGDNAKVRYSSEAVGLVRAKLHKGVILYNGWQRVGNN